MQLVEKNDILSFELIMHLPVFYHFNKSWEIFCNIRINYGPF